VADVRLTIGAFIEGLKKGLEEAKGYIASFAGFVKKHEGDIKKVRLESGIAFAAEILAVRNVVKAYGESEQANIKLAQAMKARGVYTEELFTQTVASADAMMRLTTFDDEVIKGAQTMLIALANLTGNGLERATKATLDLAQAKELDLSTAATMVARAINGDTDSIGRYIKVSTDGMNESQRFEAVLAALAKTFGGQAEAATAGTGALKQLSNMYGELKESLGSALMPILSQLAKWLSDILPKMQKWVESNKTLVAVLAGGGVAGTGLVMLLAQFALAFSNPVTGIIAVVAAAAISIGLIIAKFNTLRMSIDEVKNVALITNLEDIDAAMFKTRGQIDELQKKIEYMSASEQEGDLYGAGQIDAAGRKIRELMDILDQLAKQKNKIILDAASTSGAGDAGADGATPTIGGGAKGEEPAWLTELMFRAEMEKQAGEQLLDLHNEMDEKEWDRARASSDILIGIDRARLNAQQAMAGAFLSNYVQIFQTAFGAIFNSTKSFGKSIAVAMLEAFIGLLQMAVDSYLMQFMAKLIMVNGEIMLSSLYNPANLVKLAIASAIAGSVKGALGAIVNSAKGSMSSSIPKYEYGGVVPETGLALVHKGEHIWNPQHPGAGGANSFTFNHYGDLNSESAAKRAMREFEEALISGNMRRRLA
jgi:hypothetical protein